MQNVANPTATAAPTAVAQCDAHSQPVASVAQPEIPVQAKENDEDFQKRALRLDCTLPENRAGAPDDQALWLAHL